MESHDKVVLNQNIRVCTTLRSERRRHFKIITLKHAGMTLGESRGDWKCVTDGVTPVKPSTALRRDVPSAANFPAAAAGFLFYFIFYFFSSTSISKKHSEGLVFGGEETRGLLMHERSSCDGEMCHCPTVEQRKCQQEAQVGTAAVAAAAL